MTDKIQLSQQNEIKQVPSSEAETEQVGIKIKSPPTEEEKSLLPQSVIQNSERTWSVQSLAPLITVMGMLSGAVYLAILNFHGEFPILAVFKTVNFSIWELLTFSRVATGSFLVITTVTTTFILGMGVNTVAVCFVFRKFAWRTFYTILSLYAIAAFSLSFFTMLSKFVPYSITIAEGNLKFPAIYIVIFYDIYLVTLICALICTAQCLLSFWCKQEADVQPRMVM